MIIIICQIIGIMVAVYIVALILAKLERVYIDWQYKKQSK